MKKSFVEVKRFYTRNYYIDIVYDFSRRLREAWLVRKEYGISILMFGEFDMEEDEFIELVEGNLAEYIEDYEKKYCGGGEND